MAIKPSAAIIGTMRRMGTMKRMPISCLLWSEREPKKVTGEPAKCSRLSTFRPSRSFRTVRRTRIRAGILASGRLAEPAEVMRPASAVTGDLGRIRKATLRHAQQGAAIVVDQVDLDEARSRRHLLIPVPAEAIGEPMHRHDLAEGSTCDTCAVADTLDQVESTRMRLGRDLLAHPAQDLL